MAEYIEREALLKEMYGLHTIPVYIGHVTDEDIMFENMVDVVREQPTADVQEVKHGHWEEVQGQCFRCSECHHGAIVNIFNEFVLTKHCHNCGAKMTERKDKNG